MLRSAIFVLFQVGVAFCSDGVPVLLWTGHNLPEDIPMPLSGHSIRERDFGDTFVNPLSTGKLLVAFVQDELSLEDFLLYRDAYKNVQSRMQPEQSLTFPSVLDPMAAVRSEANGHTRILELRDPVAAVQSLKQLQLDGDTVLIVRLHHTHSAASARDVRQNDELIGEVDSYIQHKYPSLPRVSVYTTHKLRQPRDIVMQDAGRRLLAVSSNDTTGLKGFFLSGSPANSSACAMLYLDSLVLSVAGDPKASTNWSSVVLGKKDLEGSIECQCGAVDNTTGMAPPCPPQHGNSSSQMNNITAAIVSIRLTHTNFSANATVNVTGFNMRFTMVQDKRYQSKWWITQTLVVALNGDTVTFNYNSDIGAITAPISASYHCWRQPYLSSSSPANVTLNATCTAPICYNVSATFLPFRISFVNLQVQGLKLKSATTFGAAYDCTAFFSIPTWMGLLTALILIVIAIFGITMLAKIETFDQFDDAKGKTIVVTNTE